MQLNALLPELAVSSCADSLGFYCGLLGFTILYQRPEEGFAVLQLGAAQLMLDEIGHTRTFDPGALLERPFGRGMNLQIEVERVAPLLARLAQANWPLRVPLEDKWYRQNNNEVGNRQFVVADPDGYLLRFAEDLGWRLLTAG